MTSNKMRFLNMMQNVKIKKERLSDDDDVVLCRVCLKGFANATALSNHVRVEHIGEYLSGEDLCLVKQEQTKQVKQTKAQQREAAKRQIQLKTEQLISSMSPANLTSLASPDVSYIIIKADGDAGAEERKRKERPDKRRERRERDGGAAKEREPLPITGPFECLQPSNLVADGTCHQIFFSCCEYSAHYRDEHTRRRKGTRCQVCEKLLCVEGADGGPHACQTCGRGFETPEELVSHNATAHTKLRPYRCNECGKHFTQLGGLQQHARSHSGDRPYPCTVCSKAFTQKSGLEQHLRIHTKVRPYRCVICSKSFSQSIHLKQHMRTHTNVSPFQCAVCSKRFKQSSHLNYHLKYHDPAQMSGEQRARYDRLVGLIAAREAAGAAGGAGDRGGDAGEQPLEVYQMVECKQEINPDQIEEDAIAVEHLEEMSTVEQMDEVQLVDETGQLYHLEEVEELDPECEQVVNTEYILGDCVVEDIE